MYKRNLRFIFILFGILCLWAKQAEPASAEEKTKTITVYNGDFAEEGDDWSEDELFFVGDTGQLLPIPDKSDYDSDGEYMPGADNGTVKRWEFLSDHPEIVSIDSDGNYKIKAGGKAIATINGYSTAGVKMFEATFRFLACSDTSTVKLKKENVELFLTAGGTAEQTIALSSAPDFTYYTFEARSSNSQMTVSCTFDPQKKTITLSSYDSGKTTLTVTINGVSFTINVHIHIVSINKSTSLLAVKGTTKLKIKDYKGKIKWKSTNKKIATVNASGKVTGKKTGNAVIYATLGTSRVGCAVSVVSKKLKSVITEAKKIARGKYSQAKRMQTGFYDCSSLVWRSYKKAGKYFGDKTYAPVAANIAKYCISRKKKIKGGLSYKNISGMKLRPGDLLFQTGSNNNRYKGIYHVEMFIGYDCLYIDGSQPVLTTLWATRGSNYGFEGALMARP